MQKTNLKTAAEIREPHGRVAGWDLVRGLCAFAVATYHLLIWSGLHALHTFGSYGVYMFFVLSGASLAYTYYPRWHAGKFSFAEFLFVRWWRLAPLYILLIILVLPQLGIWTGPWTTLIWTLALNASFLFAFDHPALRAILTGGWSLGIEAIYYLVFPLVLWVLRSWRISVAVFVVLLAVQVAWVSRTVGATFPPHIGLNYYNVQGFAAYFMGGCMIGLWQLRTGGLPHLRAGMASIFAGFALMLAVNPARSGEELLEWRGVLLGGLCFVLVAMAARVSLSGRLLRAAQYLGDSTYGVYLIHPVLFFYLIPSLGLEWLKTGSASQRVAMVLALLLASFLLALCSERFFERPLRQWSKSRWVAMRHARLTARTGPT